VAPARSGRRHAACRGRWYSCRHRDIEVARAAEVVVDAGNGDDRDRERVEELLTAGNRGATGVAAV